jgi:hypothetical protein
MVYGYFWLFLYVYCGLSGTLSTPEWQAAQVRLVLSLVAADRLGRTNNLATYDHNVSLFKESAYRVFAESDFAKTEA